MNVITKDGITITCTPGEFIELKMKGAFSDVVVDMQADDRKPKESHKAWVSNGMADIVPVYGCNFSVSDTEKLYNTNAKTTPVENAGKLV